MLCVCVYKMCVNNPCAVRMVYVCMCFITCALVISVLCVYGMCMCIYKLCVCGVRVCERVYKLCVRVICAVCVWYMYSMCIYKLHVVISVLCALCVLQRTVCHSARTVACV